MFGWCTMTAKDLRDWRYDKRLTQAQAAELMGYSLRQYVAFENRPGELSDRIDGLSRGAQRRAQNARHDPAHARKDERWRMIFP